MRHATFASVLLSFLLAGCQGGDSMTSGQFTPSTTAPAPGLVKLVRKSTSNERVVVDALIYGPEPGLDLAAFAFGIRIGDPGRAHFVSQGMYRQTALVADAGQTISIDIDGTSDPSLVQVRIAKDGGGAGNGIADSSAVVVELAFDLSGSGTTTLALVGIAGLPPRAISSNHVPIATVTFDDAEGTLRGVTTGGGRY